MERYCDFMAKWAPLILVVALSGTAWATMSLRRSWVIVDEDKTARMTINETAEGIEVYTNKAARFEPTRLTKQEAAELGRALLEAAGETEKARQSPPHVYFHEAKP